MVKIWLDRERQVLLARYPDTRMVKDNRPEDIKDFWRFKVYVKEDHLLKSSLTRSYAEPYQVATRYCGGHWNDYNAPFIVQIPECNLDCVWCYVPKEMRCASQLVDASAVGKYFTVDEIIEMWKANTKTGILRISGGEPFLAPQFLVQLGKAFRDEFEKTNYHRRYLWIDTNLLGRNYHIVVSTLSRMNIPFGVCGCFKGFDRFHVKMNMKSDIPNVLDFFEMQLNNARAILDAMSDRGELFFYIPEVTQYMDRDAVRKSIRYFVGRLVTVVHRCAPLRMTVLQMKQYESNRPWQPQFPTGVTKELWNEFLVENYPKRWLWLPQFQIPMRSEK
jgi:organic radical activating enzyme